MELHIILQLNYHSSTHCPGFLRDEHIGTLLEFECICTVVASVLSMALN
jgi:hypothetical protein